MSPARVELASGVELHFVEAGSGPPVVLLHGGMGDCHSWAPQFEALSARHRVISYSRRHYSPNGNLVGDGHSLDHDLADLADLQQQLGMGPAHLVGTSYGALVALAYAVERPRHVLSLALAEPPLHGWACRTQRGRALHAAFLENVWSPAAAAFDSGQTLDALKMLADGIAGHAVFDSMPPQRLAAALRNAAGMCALAHAPEPFSSLTRAEVAAITVPILLIRGERSNGLHPCVMDELARVLPGAAQAVIGGAGHNSAAENPAGFNAALVPFVGQIHPAAATAT